MKVLLHITGISVGFPVFSGCTRTSLSRAFLEIKNRLQNLIFHLDQTQCFIDCFFIFTGNDRHRITYTANPLIEDQTVIRRWLRISLSGNTESVLRHIFPGIDGFDTRNLLLLPLF